jgi:hypothetical protein
MKILLVSWSILPQSGGTSVIVENLARSFDRDQLVVFGSRRFNQRNNVKRPENGPQFKYFFTELSLFGRGARFFEWFGRSRFRALVRELKRVIVQEKVTHVVGVYPNIMYCLAASRAAKDCDLPFSSYFHNTYTENSAITDPNAQHNQSEIFEHSDNIFVMSEGMSSFYEQKYKLEKFVPLVHTFDKYPDPGANTGLPGSGKERYKLVAIGNFNQSNLDATRRLLDAIRSDDRFSLSLYTHVPKILLARRGLNPAYFEHMGSVAPDDVHAEIQKYDICVLTHGFEGDYGEVEYKTIFPTRTIPLLLSGKPILAHSPKGAFLNVFLKKNRCAELVDEPRADEIIKGLEKIVNSNHYQKSLTSNALKAAEQFYSPNVVSTFLRRLQG